ncbi:hypothetical protein DFH09DRAFT_1351460 [Mycena vulgaris]|nr:hypothetical protein DFH09DRAFT_1351460 [Mycena vulgaris]
MPDAATQTEQAELDELEREFKREAIIYVEGKPTNPPSAAMLSWLTKNLVPAKPLPESLARTEEEKLDLARLRQESVAELMRLRELGKENREKLRRAGYYRNPLIREEPQRGVDTPVERVFRERAHGGRMRHGDQKWDLFGRVWSSYPKRKQFCSCASMDPAYRDLIFETIRQLEADPRPRDIDISKCAHCDDGNPTFRCLHCFGAQFLCRKCMLHQHLQTPLHRIEMWTGARLAGASLQALGMRIRLGHKPGDLCPSPLAQNDFIILNAHGAHQVSLDYCDCPGADSHEKQLRTGRFYPDQCTSPKHAVAFELAHLHNAWATPSSMRVRRNSQRKKTHAP